MDTNTTNGLSPRYRFLKRLCIALIGGTVLLLGIVMILLPGPGILATFAGLAILASEFLWARRALRKCKDAVERVRRNGGWWRFWRRMKRTAPKPVAAPSDPAKSIGQKTDQRHEARAKEKQLA